MLRVELANSWDWSRFGWWRNYYGAKNNVYRTLDKSRKAFDFTHHGHLFHLGPIYILFLEEE